jgi:transposase
MLFYASMKRKRRAVHVATVRKTRADGTVYESHLLRRTYREGGQVKHETLGNLSDLPPDAIEYLRKRLKGVIGPGEIPEGFEIIRSLPHGHVAAVLGTLRQCGLEAIIGSKPSRERSLVVALIASRLLSPTSKLATRNQWEKATAQSSLADELELGDTKLREPYEVLDWLLQRKTRIENKLAKKHLSDGTLVLYDVSSSYYTGRVSGLVQYGYSRDGKKGLPQIVYGLLCTAEGCPIAVEVFAGNTADPNTLSAQVAKVRQRFRLKRVVLVGDRGMITSKRIDEDLRGIEGLDWITALRSDAIKKLVSQQTIQLSLFDETDLAEVTSDDFPGERLIVCRNPLLADQRARKRNELLEATEKHLALIAAAVSRKRNPLRGKDKIGLRVGRTINQYKMAKHFELVIEDDKFEYHRLEEKIAFEAALDGLYVIRASVEQEALSSEETVRAYKDLAHVERAFRSLKTIDLHLRPIFHHKDDRISAHVFLCMLAYYVEWHMRAKLKELIFEDNDRESAEALRSSVVAPAPRSESAKQKDSIKRNSAGTPVQSFQSLLADLGTLCQNRIRTGGVEYNQLTSPTPLQARAFQLLGVASLL